MDEKQKTYERFKLQWMLDHGYTLNDLVAELEDIRNDFFLEEPPDTVFPYRFPAVFEYWQFNRGFGSEIWPCFDEWMECEGQEKYSSDWAKDPFEQDMDY